MGKKINIFLQVGYGLLLISECITMYLGRIHYYDVARLLTSVIFILLTYEGDKTEVKNLYLYTTIAFVIIADILTMFCNGFLFYIGLSIFTVSYLSIASILYRNRRIRERKNIPPVLSILAIFLILLLILFYFVPDIRETILWTHTVIHTIVLGIILVWAIKVNRGWNGKKPLYIYVALLIVLANICYFTDIILLNSQYILMRIFVISFHGTYLFLLSTSINKYNKTEETIVHQVIASSN